MKTVCNYKALFGSPVCLLGDKCMCKEEPQDTLSLPKQEGEYFHCQTAIEDNGLCPVQCDHCKEYYAPLDHPAKQEPDGPVLDEIPAEILEWIEQQERRVWALTAGDGDHPSNWSNGARAMYQKMRSELAERDYERHGAKEMQEYLSAQIEALKEELAIVRHFRDNIAGDLELARVIIQEQKDWIHSHC